MKSERKKHRGVRRVSVIVLSTAMILTMSAMNVFAGDQDGSGDLGADRNDPPIYNGEHIDGDWVGTLQTPGPEQQGGRYAAAINAVNGTDPEVTGTVRATVPNHYAQYYGVMLGEGSATVGGYLIVEEERGSTGHWGTGIGVDPSSQANGSVSVGANISSAKVGVELKGAENSAADVKVDHDIYAGDVGVLANGKSGTVYNVTVGGDIKVTSLPHESKAVQIEANKGNISIKCKDAFGSGDGVLINNNQGDVALNMNSNGSEYLTALHVVNNSGTITSYTNNIGAAQSGILVTGSDNGTVKIVNTDTIFAGEECVLVDLASEDGALPDITTKEFYVVNTLAKVTVNGTFNQKLTNKLLDSIHYIIDSDASLAGVQLSGADLGTVTIPAQSASEQAKTYHTLTRGAHVLTITVPEGKTLLTSGNASIVPNGNGTYILTVRDGGKVTLSAVDDSKDSSSDANKGDSSAASAGAGKFVRSAKYSRIAASGKKVVRDVNVTPTSADESADAQAEKATTSKAKASGTAKAAASQEASSDNGSSKMVMIVVAAIALAGLAYFLFGRRKNEDEQ